MYKTLLRKARNVAGIDICFLAFPMRHSQASFYFGGSLRVFAVCVAGKHTCRRHLGIQQGC